MNIDSLYESLIGSSVIDKNNFSDFPRYISNYFSNPSYFNRDKNIKIDIVDMSVDSYIREAKRLLTKSWGRPTVSRKSTNSDKVELYAEKMKQGVKFPLPFLSYIDGLQDGLHRVEAAKMIGIRSVPVAVINNVREIKDEY